MKTNLFYFFAVFCLLFSCKKGNDSSLIVVGDPEGMIINTYDTLLFREVYKKSINIDADNDQINDFRLISFNLSGAAMGVSPQNGTSIVSLNNSATILSYSETDTLFHNLKKDTVHDGSKVEIFLTVRESCERIGSNDEYKKIWNQNKVLVRKEDQSISTTERFVPDSITITRVAYGDIPSVIYQSPDTTVYGQFVYLDKCNTIINNEVIYFGIMIGEKLGWIKLMIMDDYKIFLMESAIQK